MSHLWALYYVMVFFGGIGISKFSGVTHDTFFIALFSGASINDGYTMNLWTVSFIDLSL